MTIVLVHGNPETEAIWTISFRICAAMTLFVCLLPDLAPQFPQTLTVVLKLIATGSPTSSESWHNRSTLWGMTGVGATSYELQWIAQV